MIRRLVIPAAMAANLGVWGLWGADAQAADVAGAKDPPFITRLEGSEIVAAKALDETPYALYVAPAAMMGGAARNVSSTMPVSGRAERVTYRAGSGKGAADLYGHYIQALGQAGFQMLFRCQGMACGGAAFSAAVAGDDKLFAGLEAEQRYLAARLPRPGGDLFVAVYVSAPQSDTTASTGASTAGALARIDVVNADTADPSPVSFTTAYALKTGLDEDGHMPLYDLAFDPGSSVLRLDARPAVQKIADYLQANPSVNVLIVSHTTNDLPPDRAQALTRQRAQQIVAALISNFGVAAGRVQAEGAGAAAPIASNATAAGRQLNERIEVVLR